MRLNQTEVIMAEHLREAGDRRKRLACGETLFSGGGAAVGFIRTVPSSSS